MTALETPSGKSESTENFPVERLVERAYRRHVTAFYIFARAADDISDDPLLPPEEKIARLDTFDAALLDPNDQSVPSVIPLRESLRETGVTPQHARDLLIAFKRDATKLRYQNWEELLDYCRYSAAPVGRYLLDLHGESQSAWPANDALCTVLQIINHLQDCADDYRELDRVYIPLDMIKRTGARIEDLAAAQTPPNLRKTLDVVLNEMAPMMRLALTFTPQVNNRMLRIDVAVINTIALKLMEQLRRRDPLAERVKLNKFQKFSALVTGAGRALFL